MLVTIFLLPYRAWLILGLIALLFPVGLVLLHPEWYTLTRGIEEARYVYGKQMIPAMFLLFIPTWLLILRLPHTVYLSNLHAWLICALPVLALSVIVWLLSRERSSSPVMLALVLACWVLMGTGVGHAINALDYYDGPPAVTKLLDRLRSSII